MNSTQIKQYFPALTGVRAIAAYLVFFHHYNPFSVERFGAVLNQFVREFHVGVSVFFVLSGFLIAHRYFHQTEKFNRRAYLVNRIARVYPMYFIVTTIAFIFSNSSWAVYLFNITFLRGFFDDLKFTLVSQGWSLTVEECFYLLAPIAFLFIRRYRWALFATPVALVALGLAMVLVFGNRTEHGFFDNNRFMFIYTFFGRCFEFFCGVGLAVYFKKYKHWKLSFTWVGFMLTLMVVFSMSRLGSPGVSGVQSNLGIMLNNFLLPICIACSFYGLLHERTILQRLLSSGVSVVLGKASYVFFLIHVGVIASSIDKLAGGNLVLLFMLLNVTAIIGWWVLEEPLGKLIRRLAVTQA